jgi:hypothetical protein
MQLRIQRQETGYTARVTPSHGDSIEWEQAEPVGQGVLIDALIELGFHQQDIGDAFYEADPEWLDRPLDEGGTQC